ncbi:hypothetical protein [Microcoleus sp. D2_18a_B4]|uniref:hypothetical protein n=1 Tax=Microcoleus sp. D2_18a_B4 TaxID=3055329 RepID=UPI002FD3AEB9
MSTHHKYLARLGPVLERKLSHCQRTVVHGSADAHRKPHAQFISTLTDLLGTGTV